MKIVNKNDFIVDRCRGKSVIDLACVNHDMSEDQIKEGTWLHENIRKVAGDLIGFDIAWNEVVKLQIKGYQILLGDIEQVLSPDKFDVVVLGDCIEHLFNPGQMLDSIKSYCHSETTIVLSTVNCWSVKYFISAMIGNESCMLVFPLYHCKPFAHERI